MAENPTMSYNDFRNRSIAEQEAAWGSKKPYSVKGASPVGTSGMVTNPWYVAPNTSGKAAFKYDPSSNAISYAPASKGSEFSNLTEAGLTGQSYGDLQSAYGSISPETPYAQLLQARNAFGELLKSTKGQAAYQAANPGIANYSPGGWGSQFSIGPESSKLTQQLSSMFQQ